MILKTTDKGLAEYHRLPPDEHMAIRMVYATEGVEGMTRDVQEKLVAIALEFADQRVEEVEGCPIRQRLKAEPNLYIDLAEVMYEESTLDTNYFHLASTAIQFISELDQP